MNLKDILAEYIKEFLASKERTLMIDGERYYQVENDVIGSNKEIKLSHGFMANMIDEKVQYLLGKEFTFECEDKGFLEAVKNIMGEDLLYEFQDVAYEASNKGIAWWQVYFNEEGEFKYKLIPSEQCCPIWKGSLHHKELEGMLRVYDVETYTGRERKKDITHVEYYEPDGITYYIYDDGRLLLDSEKYLNVGDGVEKIGHYIKDGEHISFGTVPFVWCKNNRKELPDIKFVKTLIDEYDKSRSDIAQLLEDCRNWIAVIAGYEGDADNDDIMKMIKEKRRVFVDENGNINILTPKIDTEAAESHGKQLKEDINTLGRTISRSSEGFKSLPSGKALKFMYGGIDLKCNIIEHELKRMFRQVIKFLEIALGMNSKSKIEIIFNRDIMINESDVIEDCKKSVGMLSDETVIANHPYVKDVDKEIAKIKKENSKEDDDNKPYKGVFIEKGEGDGEGEEE